MMSHDALDERWWDDVDDAVLTCLRRHGALSPADVARHLGVTESVAVSLLCLLAQEGRVTIRLVEHRGVEQERRSRVA